MPATNRTYRALKTSFWSDSKMRRLSDGAKLVYMSLWNQVDDDGRMEGDEWTVCHFIGTGANDEHYDTETYRYTMGAHGVMAALGELEEAGRIIRYEVDGNPYIAVVRFKDHQKLDHYKPSRYPAPPAREVSRGVAIPREKSRTLASDCEPSREVAPDRIGRRSKEVRQPQTLNTDDSQYGRESSTHELPIIHAPPRVDLGPQAVGRGSARGNSIDPKAAREGRVLIQRGEHGGGPNDIESLLDTEPATKTHQ